MAMNKITKGYPNWDVPYNENVDEYNNTIGNEELLTTSKTIKGAINEIHNVADDVTTINADISNLKKSVAQNTSQLNAMAQLSMITKSSDQAISSVTETKILLDGIIGNTDNLEVVNGSIKIKENGIYNIVSHLTCATNQSVSLSVRLYKNEELISMGNINTFDNTYYSNVLYINKTLELNKNDIVSINLVCRDSVITIEATSNLKTLDVLRLK